MNSSVGLQTENIVKMNTEMSFSEDHQRNNNQQLAAAVLTGTKQKQLAHNSTQLTTVH